MGKYIVRENSSGKTHEMLETIKDDNVIVICRNPYSMRSKATAYGIPNLRFVSYEHFKSYMSDFCGEKIAIDELGDFFKNCFDVELDAFTMTVE